MLALCSFWQCDAHFLAPCLHVILIAGPNGAGKSTIAPRLLKGALGVQEFVKADTIASGLSAFLPGFGSLSGRSVHVATAGGIVEEAQEFCVRIHAFTRSFAPWLQPLKTKGYRVRIVFLFLPDSQLAVERVRQRVRIGGHDVPVR